MPLPFLLMAANATLERPRLTYAEFGAWVQARTGTPVTVAPALRERKATVLVADRPVAETMRAFAEAFALEWERTETGLKLRGVPAVAAAEAAQIALEARLDREGLRRQIESLIARSGQSDAALDAEYARLQRRLEGAGKVDSAALRSEMGRILIVRNDGIHRLAGRFLAGLNDAERADLLAGKPFYAADPTIPGTRPLPTGTDASEKTVRLKIKPGTDVLTLDVHSEASGVGLRISADNSPDATEAKASGPMARRQEEWARVTDPEVLRTRLRPLAIRPVLRRTPYRTLADLLVRLHARTGIPLVADGFREAADVGDGPEATDVGAWLKALRLQADRWQVDFPALRARSSKGWLMIRRDAAWRQLAREIPEGPIRALEAAAARKGGAGLDDYAAFAGPLTEAQAQALGPEDLVMDAPGHALVSLPFLRLWDALPKNLRAMAQKEEGLPLETMSSLARERFLACLREGLDNPWMPEGIAYVVGVKPLPPGLRLQVGTGEEANVYEPFRTPGAGETMPAPSPYRTVQATLGPPGTPLVQVGLPLAPLGI